MPKETRKSSPARRTNKAVTSSRPSSNIEEEYVQEILIKVPGYGNKQHRVQQASDIKRILEVKLQSEIEVCTRIGGRKWTPVQRRDSNAYVSDDNV